MLQRLCAELAAADGEGGARARRRPLRQLAGYLSGLAAAGLAERADYRAVAAACGRDRLR